MWIQVKRAIEMIRAVPAEQQRFLLEDVIINDFLQRIFLVTVNSGKIKKGPTSEFLLFCLLSLLELNTEVFGEIIFKFLYSIEKTENTPQKQLFANVLQNRCSWKFLNIYRERPALESVFNKVYFIKRHSNTGVFLRILQNFQEQLFCRTSLVAGCDSFVKLWISV